jgi:TonB family protein
MIVALLHTSLFRFFAISTTLHTLLFFLVYSGWQVKIARQDLIPVSVLPIPERDQPAPKRMPSAPPTRSVKATAIVAKKDSPTRPEKTAAREKIAKSEISREDLIPATPSPAPHREPIIEEQTVIAERQLPTVRELLPPLTWSSSNPRAGSPVSLNTNDPVFVSYFNKIKQSIESQWEYPEIALRYGLQGKLSLQFTIAKNGQLEQLRLTRSSGSQLLDEEALRAIKAAAPFPPIPPWIKANPLPIVASMEYHDNRLNYRLAP